MAMALARMRCSPSPCKFRNLCPHPWPLCSSWKPTQILYRYNWPQGPLWLSHILPWGFYLSLAVLIAGAAI